MALASALLSYAQDARLLVWRSIERTAFSVLASPPADVLVQGVGGLSALFVLFLAFFRFREYPACFFYLPISVMVAGIQLCNWYWTVYLPSTRHGVWVSGPLEGGEADAALHLWTFVANTILMMPVCLVDCLVYMPVEIWRCRRKGQKVDR